MSFILTRQFQRELTRSILVMSSMIWVEPCVARQDAESPFYNKAGTPTLKVTGAAAPGATESIGEPGPKAPLRPWGSGVVWLPDMEVYGFIIVENTSKRNFAFLSKEEGVDYRDRIKLVSVMRDYVYLPIEKFPSVRYSYYMGDAVEKSKIVLESSDKKSSAPLNVNFTFGDPGDYRWEPGEYELTFKLDFFPGIVAPQFASVHFFVKYIETEKDRLNVAWYRFQNYLRGTSLWSPNKIAEQNLREKGIPLINLLVENFPDDAVLLYERVAAWQILRERRNIVADLTKVVQLMESGQSPTMLGISMEPMRTTRERTVAYYKRVLQLATVSAERHELLDSLTPASPDADKKKALAWAIDGQFFDIPFKAIDIIVRLNIPDGIPTLLDIMWHANKRFHSGRWSYVRDHAWKALLILRPEAKQVEYNPLAPEAERQAAVEKLRAVLKIG